MGNKVGGQSQSEEETEVVVPAARVPPLSAHPGESRSDFNLAASMGHVPVLFTPADIL